MPENKYELGVDLVPSDSLLDGLTFADLILAVHCNCREGTRAAVQAEPDTGEPEAGYELPAGEEHGRDYRGCNERT